MAAPSQDVPGASVIEVEELVTHYGPRMILKGVDMEVQEGEIMVL